MQTNIQNTEYRDLPVAEVSERTGGVVRDPRTLARLKCRHLSQSFLATLVVNSPV
jgi:hypothetical protein